MKEKIKIKEVKSWDKVTEEEKKDTLLYRKINYKTKKKCQQQKEQ